MKNPAKIIMVCFACFSFFLPILASPAGAMEPEKTSEGQTMLALLEQRPEALSESLFGLKQEKEMRLSDQELSLITGTALPPDIPGPNVPASSKIIFWDEAAHKDTETTGYGAGWVITTISR